MAKGAKARDEGALVVGGEEPAERPFVHLHLHSEYSLLDGGNRLDKLVKRVRELGMGAVAVTDHGNLHAAVSFYRKARAEGIKPILGVEAYVAPKSRLDKTYTGVSDGGYHLVLLAENATGWRNLLYLCSEAYLTGFYFKPRMDREILEAHSSGLIAINGHLGSEMGEHLLSYETSGGARGGDRSHYERAAESAQWHARAFADEGTGPRFFVELQHHVPEQIAINPHLIRIAREQNLPLVCDNDSHFLRAEDHDAHDTLICISTGKSKFDEGRMRYTPELYVKSPEQMWELFGSPEYNNAEYGRAGEEALLNTKRIADRCNVTLPEGASHAPVVVVRSPAKKDLPAHDDPGFGGDLTAWFKAFCSRFELLPANEPGMDRASLTKECDRALRLLCEAGMVWRYGPGILGSKHGEVEGESPSPQPSPQGGEGAERACEDWAKWARLNRELKILSDKLISAYFLIVWDFVSWGRQRGIPAIARGSGVGTMTGYVLGLSNACPVHYGLLFERFTDPDRSEYPDIDIDLCQDGRGSVIDYVREKYGHVAQIITFGTLKARAAVRDVGRVLEYPLTDTDKLAKMIPEELGITLDRALEAEPDLKRVYETDEVARRVIDNARVIEGQARHSSVHAAGVIVATRPLHEVVPLYRQSGGAENEIVTQWDGPTCESMGLLKMDFLGLRTLSVIERCKQMIQRSLSERQIWEAVGRGEEYERWQSGRGAEWQRPDQDLPRPGRVAEGDGPGAPDLPRDGGDARGRALRADQPDAAGCGVGPDEHRGGLRKAHTPRVRARAADRGGLSDGADDRVRAGDHDGSDHSVAGGNGAARGNGPGPLGAREIAREASEVAHSATLPPSHSAASFAHPLDLDRLSYTDPRIFALFARGDTTGVFQFESGGMRRLLIEMKPDRLEDLIAANALFRPGPMDLIPDYNMRKHRQSPVPRVHEIVDRFTAETYGVMVYQEQVMQIVHELGGIPLRSAYSLIKAISKKKEKIIEQNRPLFVEGAGSKGLGRDKANDLFELILKFAGYGFNKSHSTGYAIVAYQTAYLKTFFPAHYMAAFLSFESQAQKASDWIPYLEDCKRTRFIDPASGEIVKTGVEVRPPDVNLSEADFAVVYESKEGRTPASGHVRFGLRAIKGAGSKAIEAIIAERERGGAFASLFEFCERVPAGAVNKATIEALIKSGAFDGVHSRGERASMVATIDQAVSAGQKLAADRAAGQGALFGMAVGFDDGRDARPTQDRVPLVRAEAWGEAETLRQEKDTLGFYVSSHPLEQWKDWSGVFARLRMADLAEVAQDQRVIVAALVQSVRTIVVRNGKSAGQKMAIVTLEDLTGTADAVLFAECYTKFAHLFEDDGPKFVLGRMDHSRGGPQIIVDRMVPIEGQPLEKGRLHLRLSVERMNGSGIKTVDELYRLLTSRSVQPGGAKPSGEVVPVMLELESADRAITIAPEPALRVELEPGLVREAALVVGEGNLMLVGGKSIEPEDASKRGGWRGRR